MRKRCLYCHLVTTPVQCFHITASGKTPTLWMKMNEYKAWPRFLPQDRLVYTVPSAPDKLHPLFFSFSKATPVARDMLLQLVFQGLASKWADFMQCKGDSPVAVGHKGVKVFWHFRVCEVYYLFIMLLRFLLDSHFVNGIAEVLSLLKYKFEILKYKAEYSKSVNIDPQTGNIIKIRALLKIW